MVAISSTAISGNATGWRAKLRTASFRGVEFGVTDAEGEGGRRTVLHEFPQRDLPYVEDMGLATAKFTLQAFVLGADYMDKRDKLKAALEKPGAGTLVHPWLGELQVAQGGPYKLHETAQDGGMAVFTLSFVRSDAPISPTGTVNSSRSAKLFGNAAGSQACSSFDKAFTITGQSAWVVTQSFALVTDSLATVQQVMHGNMSTITSLLGAATGYQFGALGSMGLAIWSAMQSMPLSGADSADTASKWCDVAQRDVEIADPPNAGQSRQLILTNANAVNTLITRLAAVEAGTATADATPASQAAATDLRHDLTDAVDTALDAAYETDLSTANGAELAVDADNFAASVTDMRVQALATVASAALAAPEVVEVATARTLPWLFLSWRYGGGTIANESDMVDRNGVVHPLFVPAGSLEVLRG